MRFNQIQPDSTRFNQIQPHLTRFNQDQPDSTRFNHIWPDSTRFNQIQQHLTRIDQIQPDWTRMDQMTWGWLKNIAVNSRYFSSLFYFEADWAVVKTSLDLIKYPTFGVVFHILMCKTDYRVSVHRRVHTKTLINKVRKL